MSMFDNKLVGYARRSNIDNGSVRISINVDALSECYDYTTSDGQRYIPLVIKLHSLEKVMKGESALTTVVQKPQE